jgi:MioC protein
MSITHNYTERRWGKDYSIIAIEDGGLSLALSGWGRGIRSGDYIIIKNGDDTTRYMFDTISYHSDPSDMWNGTLTFSPRE